MSKFYEILECVSNSSQRLQILEALVENELDLREIMEQLDCPRTTLQRNLSILVEKGWVEETASGYILTAYGSLILDQFKHLEENIDMVSEITPFLEAVNGTSIIKIGKINDPKLITSSRESPNKPIRYLMKNLEKADCIRSLLPVFSMLLVDLYKMEDPDRKRIELIISENQIKNLDTNYKRELTDLSENLSGELLSYDGDLPFGIFILDEKSILTAHDSLGRIEVILELKDEESLKWCNEIYRMFKQRSQTKMELVQNIGR